MGDLADAIIDGEACQLCGAHIEHGNGYPTYCSVSCAKDHGASQEEIKQLKRDLIEAGEEEERTEQKKSCSMLWKMLSRFSTIVKETNGKENVQSQTEQNSLVKWTSYVNP